ncbi:hypothetical protein [Bacillus sp. NPDC094077]
MKCIVVLEGEFFLHIITSSNAFLYWTVALAGMNTMDPLETVTQTLRLAS